MRVHTTHAQKTVLRNQQRTVFMSSRSQTGSRFNSGLDPGLRRDDTIRFWSLGDCLPAIGHASRRWQGGGPLVTGRRERAEATKTRELGCRPRRKRGGRRAVL